MIQITEILTNNDCMPNCLETTIMCLAHLSIAGFSTEIHLPKLRLIRFCSHRYVVCIMGKKKKFQRDRRKKIAKVATGNRQDRYMAEFRESFEMKVVEHQILCGKLVSQA